MLKDKRMPYTNFDYTSHLHQRVCHIQYIVVEVGFLCATCVIKLNVNKYDYRVVFLAVAINMIMIMAINNKETNQKQRYASSQVSHSTQFMIC